MICTKEYMHKTWTFLSCTSGQVFLLICQVVITTGTCTCMIEHWLPLKPHQSSFLILSWLILTPVKGINEKKIQLTHSLVGTKGSNTEREEQKGKQRWNIGRRQGKREGWFQGRNKICFSLKSCTCTCTCYKYMTVQ